MNNHTNGREAKRMEEPKGKHIFGTVKVGERGQIVIPKEAREIFNIKPGDSLVMLGDEASGLALMKRNVFMASVADAIFPKEVVPYAEKQIDDKE